MPLRLFSNRTLTVIRPFFIRTLLQLFFNRTTVRTMLNVSILQKGEGNTFFVFYCICTMWCVCMCECVYPLSSQSTGWSALHFAAERGDVTTTHSLLKAGANALLQDKVCVACSVLANARKSSGVPL